MKYCIFLLYPIHSVNHSFVQHVPLYLLLTYQPLNSLPLVMRLTVMRMHCLCSSNQLFYLIITPKYKSSDAGNVNMPKRSHNVLPLSEKICLYRKNQYRQTICGLRHPLWGSQNASLLDKGELLFRCHGELPIFPTQVYAFISDSVNTELILCIFSLLSCALVTVHTPLQPNQ